MPIEVTRMLDRYRNQIKSSIEEILGYNKIEEKTLEVPVYKFVVEHIDGSETTVYASGFKESEGFLTFWRNDGTVMKKDRVRDRKETSKVLTEYNSKEPLGLTKQSHRKIGSVKEFIVKEKLGTIDLKIRYKYHKREIVEENLETSYSEFENEE